MMEKLRMWDTGTSVILDFRFWILDWESLSYLIYCRDVSAFVRKRPMPVPESFNPWNYKPWWCQPWSILLTGAIAIGGSWLLLKALWLTLPLSLLIFVWWGYFLILWPKLIRESLESAETPQDST
jgi:hypothetical protein